MNNFVFVVQVRFVTKYRHCDGVLVCKVTNDKVVRTKISVCMMCVEDSVFLTELLPLL